MHSRRTGCTTGLQRWNARGQHACPFATQAILSNLLHSSAQGCASSASCRVAYCLGCHLCTAGPCRAGCTAAWPVCAVVPAWLVRCHTNHTAAREGLGHFLLMPVHLTFGCRRATFKSLCDSICIGCHWGGSKPACVCGWSARHSVRGNLECRQHLQHCCHPRPPCWAGNCISYHAVWVACSWLVGHLCLQRAAGSGCDSLCCLSACSCHWSVHVVPIQIVPA